MRLKKSAKLRIIILCGCLEGIWAFPFSQHAHNMIVSLITNIIMILPTMKFYFSLIFFVIVYQTQAQSLLKITYREKRSNFASLRFISLSDSNKQFQYIQSENVEDDAVKKMRIKKLVHHSQFTILDSSAVWDVVAFPANVEYLIRSDFPKEQYLIYSNSKNILGYNCRKAVLNAGKKEEIEVWFTDSLQNYFGKSYAATAPGVVLEMHKKCGRFKGYYIAEKIEFVNGNIIFPGKPAVADEGTLKKYGKGKSKLSEPN